MLRAAGSPGREQEQVRDGTAAGMHLAAGYRLLDGVLGARGLPGIPQHSWRDEPSPGWVGSLPRVFCPSEKSCKPRIYPARRDEGLHVRLSLVPHTLL